MRSNSFLRLSRVAKAVAIGSHAFYLQRFSKLGDVEDIVMKDIFIWGPIEMRKALLSDSRKLNITKINIHYEDFDFV